MRLSELTAAVNRRVSPDNASLEITGITCDSRLVTKGSLFVAIPGAKAHGNLFIPDAVKKGALAVIFQEGSKCDCLPAGIPVIEVPDTRVALAVLAHTFYGRVTEKLTVVGITGTNGKTTTSFLIEAILKAADYPTGVIGTVNCRFAGHTIRSGFTTPGPLELQELLSRMAGEQISHVVMEVSSHALDQDRVDCCQFDAVVFTNLTRDHLDYHKEMEVYFRCKERLFTELLQKSKQCKKPCSVINIDDAWGRKLTQTQQGRLVTYGLENCRADVTAKSYSLSLNGIRAEIISPSGSLKIHSALLGKYNLYNLLAAISTGIALGLSLEVIKTGLELLEGVPGRMQRVSTSGKNTVLIDYAHTPDALENVLSTLKGLNPRRLICVFGCGGNRDQGKRELMGRVAAQFSQIVILTSDNPRDEDPMDIIKQIEKGFLNSSLSRVEPTELLSNGCKEHYAVLPDRHEAIRLASKLSKEGDAVLIAGKGHEDYQIVRDKVLSFDDFLEATNAFSNN